MHYNTIYTSSSTLQFMVTQCKHRNMKYVIRKIYMSEQAVETEFYTIVRTSLKDKLGVFAHNAFMERLGFLREVHNSCKEMFKKLDLYERVERMGNKS